MKKEFNLSEKECNILINQIHIDEDIIQRDSEGNITWNINRENLKFEKGFFKEDVKQFIKEILDELEKKCWIDLTGDRLLDWEDVEKIIKQKIREIN